MLHEFDQPLVTDRIKEALQIRIHNPVHAPLTHTERQRIQCIVLVALRSESVTKSQKVRLVNGIEHFHHSTLYDLVFQRSDSQRALLPICFWNVLPLGGRGSICATMNAPMQLNEIGFQGLAILLPCPAIDPRRRIALQREIRLPQSFHIDMVQ